MKQENKTSSNEGSLSYDKEKYDYQYILNDQLLHCTRVARSVHYYGIKKDVLKHFEQSLDTLHTLLTRYHHKYKDYSNNRDKIKEQLKALNLQDRNTREEYNKLLLEYLGEVINLFDSLNMLLGRTMSWDMG